MKNNGKRRKTANTDMKMKTDGARRQERRKIDPDRPVNAGNLTKPAARKQKKENLNLQSQYATEGKK